MALQLLEVWSFNVLVTESALLESCDMVQLSCLTEVNAPITCFEVFGVRKNHELLVGFFPGRLRWHLKMDRVVSVFGFAAPKLVEAPGRFDNP